MSMILKVHCMPFKMLKGHTIYSQKAYEGYEQRVTKHMSMRDKHEM
jgi:hypothetical protein